MLPQPDDEFFKKVEEQLQNQSTMYFGTNDWNWNQVLTRNSFVSANKIRIFVKTCKKAFRAVYKARFPQNDNHLTATKETRNDPTTIEGESTNVLKEEEEQLDKSSKMDDFQKFVLEEESIDVDILKECEETQFTFLMYFKKVPLIQDEVDWHYTLSQQWRHVCTSCKSFHTLYMPLKHTFQNQQTSNSNENDEETKERIEKLQQLGTIFLRAVDEYLLTLIENTMTTMTVSIKLVNEINTEFHKCCTKLGMDPQISQEGKKQLRTLKECLGKFIAMCPPGRPFVHLNDDSWELVSSSEVRTNLRSRLFKTEKCPSVVAELDEIKNIMMDFLKMRYVAVVFVYENDDSFNQIVYKDFRKTLRDEINQAWKHNIFRTQIMKRLHCLLRVLIKWLETQVLGFYQVFEKDNSWNVLNYKDFRKELRIALQTSLALTCGTSSEQEDSQTPTSSNSNTPIPSPLSSFSSLSLLNSNGPSNSANVTPTTQTPTSSATTSQVFISSEEEKSPDKEVELEEKQEPPTVYPTFYLK